MIAVLATSYWLLPAALVFVVLRRLTRPRSNRGRLIFAFVALCWPILALLVIIGR